MWQITSAKRRKWKFGKQFLCVVEPNPYTKFGTSGEPLVEPVVPAAYEPPTGGAEAPRVQTWMIIVFAVVVLLSICGCVGLVFTFT